MRKQIYLVVGLLSLALVAYGQTAGKTKAGKVKVSPTLNNILKAGGVRFQSGGQERWSAAVELKGGKGEVLLANATVVMEWPGRLAIVQGGGKTVFDPATGKKPVADAVQNVLAQLLLEDSLDGFLAAHSSDGATRFEGSGYPDPDRKGEAIDLVTVNMPSRTDGGKSGVTKQYWFDHNTGLLVKVRYAGDQTETRLTNWRDSQGSMFPATMTVYEKGAAKYVLTIGAAAVGPPGVDSIFDGK